MAAREGVRACGAGGSVHAAWPQLRVGVSYAMNEMREDHHVDPRSATLLRALYDALSGGAASG